MSDDILHDDHGPAAPQGTGVTRVFGLRQVDPNATAGGNGGGSGGHAQGIGRAAVGLDAHGAIFRVPLGHRSGTLMAQGTGESLEEQMARAQRQRPATEPIGGMGRADLRDEKIAALTTLVTEMGAIITEQRADIDRLASRLDDRDARDAAAEAEADRVDAVCEEWRRSVLRMAPVTFPGLDRKAARAKPSTDDDPTVRAITSLRAKGLA